MIPSVAHTRLASQEKDAGLNIEESILRTLTYFDLFHYPLLLTEIRDFLDRELSVIQLSKCLDGLIAAKRVFRYQEFYMLHANPLLVHRRKEENELAVSMMEKALRIGRFLQQFPYVRAIAISGSLSKNVAGPTADIDFFIITSSNRLWIARTCMHLYKKFTFLRGRQHYYCMNYYVDESALLLDEHNIFTAIELKTLLPVSGYTVMQQFFNKNHWSHQWLPAYAFRKQCSPDRPYPILKKIAEWVFNNKLGDGLDNLLFTITSKRWKRKEAGGKRNAKGETMGLITNKHFARSNPGGFQEKLLSLYEEKLKKHLFP